MSVINFSYKWIFFIILIFYNKYMHQMFMPLYNLTGDQLKARKEKSKDHLMMSYYKLSKTLQKMMTAISNHMKIRKLRR